MADAIWLSGQLDNDDADMKTITDEMVDGVKDYLNFGLIRIRDILAEIIKTIILL